MGVKGVEPSPLVLSDLIFGDQFPTVGDTPKSDVPELNRYLWFYRPLFCPWTNIGHAPGWNRTSDILLIRQAYYLCTTSANRRKRMCASAWSVISRLPYCLGDTPNASDGGRTHFHWLRTNDDYRYTTEADASDGIRTHFLRLKASNDLPITLRKRMHPDGIEPSIFCVLNRCNTTLLWMHSSQRQSWTADSGSWVQCTDHYTIWEQWR
jgi:hypothetical protein